MSQTSSVQQKVQIVRTDAGTARFVVNKKNFLHAAFSSSIDTMDCVLAASGHDWRVRKSILPHSRSAEFARRATSIQSIIQQEKTQ
jgi:hypothetical protein